MTPKLPTKLRAEWTGTHWSIRDSMNRRSPGIQVDGALINATYRSANAVEGYIVSVHGLDMAVAAHLSREQLSMLGVGGVKRITPAFRGPGLLSLGADGKVSRGAP